MMYHVNLDELIEKARRMGDVLIPFNWPLSYRGDDDALSILKTTSTIVDGYEVKIHFSKADHGSHFLETLQIFGEHTPFLPFNVVCKIARRFLGSKYLYLVELMQEQKKVYIWTICIDKQGVPIQNPQQKNAQVLDYEGFSYYLMDPKSVKFY